MPSASTIARSAGLIALLQVSGEVLSFRGLNIRALVDRSPERGVDGDRPDFNDRAASRIECLRSAVATAPNAGEVFTDNSGGFHRIRTVPRITDLTYVCDCDAVPGDADLGLRVTDQGFRITED
jgi:hypothetical protein